MDFETIMLESHMGMVMGLDNQFEESNKLLMPHFGKSYYQTHILGVLGFVNGMCTMDEDCMKEAMSTIEVTLDLLSKARKKFSFLEKVDYEKYTIEEVHAELCYAESIFMHTLLEFFHTDRWVKFIRFGFKARNIYSAYRTCYLIAKNRNLEHDTVPAREHFLTGVHFGIGSFYLVMSMLPEKILNIIRALGFSGNIQISLQELRKGFEMKDMGRTAHCALVILAYHLLLVPLISNRIDMEEVNRVMEYMNKYLPKSTLTLLFQEKAHLYGGNLAGCEEYANKTIASKPEWKQVTCLSYIGLMVCHGFNQNWKEGVKVAERLFQDVTWTKATAAYLKITHMYMLKDTWTSEEALEVEERLGKIPSWTRKIAGRTPPLEKFVVAKVKKYIASKRLVLPAVEFTYLWRGFTLTYYSPDIAASFLPLLYKEIDKIEAEPDHEYYWEDRANALVMQGSLMRVLNREVESEALLLKALESEGKCKMDTYVIPFTYYELGLLYAKLGRSDEAVEMLSKVREEFSGYLLHNRLKLRAKSALKKLLNHLESETDGKQPESVMPDLNGKVGNERGF